MGLFPGEPYSLVHHCLTLWAPCAKNILVLFCFFLLSFPPGAEGGGGSLVRSVVEKVGFLFHSQDGGLDA